MNKQGTVIRWDNAKAFGFIRSPHTTADVFFHVRDYRGDQPPMEGLAVSFEEIQVGGKGPRAMAVRAQQATPQQHTTSALGRSNPRGRDRTKATGRSAAPAHQSSPSMAIWLLLAIWLGLLAWGAANGRLNWMLLLALAGLNMVTFLACWQDKSAARRGAWRTPESTLHLLSLAGGWPAARLAQQTLRHKSSKGSFLLVFGATALLNTAALGAWVLQLLPPS
jgi:uncharacterized membrane protein YsdA (DUF1294 family)/cold shock CspA family protein